MAKATVCKVDQPTEMLVQLIITLEGVFLIAYQIQLLRKTQVSKTNHLILWREITQQKEITDLAQIGTLLTIINLDKLDPQIIILTLLDRPIDPTVLETLEVQGVQVGLPPDHPVVVEDKS